MQGYLFSRPLSVADLKRLLSSGQEAVAGVA
jgi:EAL domain-containing protein (putative c-di-GMP-specific phosphodiesterase class I)